MSATKERVIRLRRGRPGITTYSEKVKGGRGNYEWPVRFDLSGDFVGITQWGDKSEVVDRILLSPEQVRALIRFVSSSKQENDVR